MYRYEVKWMKVEKAKDGTKEGGDSRQINTLMDCIIKFPYTQQLGKLETLHPCQAMTNTSGYTHQ